MKVNISTKLTIWYSIVFFAALAVYAFLIYFFVSRQYYTRQHNLLKETSEEILQFVEEEGDTLNATMLSQEVSVQDLNRYGLFYEIYDSNKKVIYKTTNFPKFTQPTEIVTQKVEQVIAKDVYNSTFQLYVSPIKHLSQAKSKTSYYVLVGQSTLYVTTVLSKIRELLLFFGIGMLIVAGIGGWYMARRALKPVAEITDTARNLTAFHLDKRLPETGNDDELGRLVHTFNEMLDRIQSGVMKISQFSSDASHELRTPLTIMRGEIEIALRKDRTTKEYKKVLNSMLEEVQRMDKIVGDLLFCARADTGHVKPKNTEGDLVKMLHENIEKMRPIAEQKNISFSYSPEIQSIVYQIDPGLFSQLIYNIADNAIKYTEPGGRIDASIHEDKDGIIIEIRDTGTGIPEDEIPRVFDRFYRVDKARSGPGQSSGLGLSICKWIVETYGGRITIESEENSGTTVTMSFPLHEKTS